MDNLPTEILEEIFKNMSYEDINKCKKVCLRWRAIIKSFYKKLQGQTRSYML